MANATARIQAALYDSPTLKMVLSREFGEPAMTHFSTPQDNSFPYVLVCSMLGTIISLATVCIMTAASFAPVVGA